MYQERGINLDLPEGEVRYRVQEIFDSAKKTEELKVQVNKLNQRVEEAEGEVKRLETASANDIQQLKDLKAEVEVLKKQVVNRDTQITALQERLSGLESQLDPQRVVVITKEEYARLTATKVLDKFTRWELTKEIIKRFFGKKVS
jgi:chromosome segregation ATPase